MLRSPLTLVLKLCGAKTTLVFGHLPRLKRSLLRLGYSPRIVILLLPQSLEPTGNLYIGRKNPVHCLWIKNPTLTMGNRLFLVVGVNHPRFSPLSHPLPLPVVQAQAQPPPRPPEYLQEVFPVSQILTPHQTPPLHLQIILRLLL